MQKFSKRLRALRQRHGLTQQALAAKLGISLSSVAHWENGDGTPGPTNLSKIAELLHCTIPYLLGDEDAAPPKIGVPSTTADKTSRPTTHSQFSDGHLEAQSPNFRRVPVVSWAKAGAAQDYADLCHQIDEQLDTECRDPNAFALILEGDSMEPKFEAGYRVIFSPNNEPRNGDYVVARLNESHGVLFKRFRRTGSEGQTIRLESLNPAYGPLEFPVSAFRFIYPAVEFRCTLPR